MRAPALVLPVILLVAAACSQTPPPASAPPTPAPTVAPSPTVAPTPSDAPATPSASPIATPAPSDTPAPAMTPEEEALIAQLRLDAGVNCVPRRTDLPEGAIRGIECRPNDPLVARVGVYWFDSPNEAAFAYMTRMAEQGVDVNAGQCNSDIPGDEPWTPGDGEGSIEDPGVFNWENSVLSPDRIGCFLDDDGMANVRATCGNAYIGVLGSGTDLSDLQDWTWRYPEGYEPGTPDSPGICLGPARLAP